MDAELYAWGELAKSIIILAIRDYAKALKNYKRQYKMYGAKIRMKECQEFFTSDWFAVLSEIDGKMLMKKIEKEYENMHFERKKNIIL